MKVQAKIGLLLLVVLLTFIGGVAGVRAYDRARFVRFAAARQEEQSRAFDDFLRQWREPLEMFVRDNSVQDSLVQALQGDTADWAESNLSETVLASYHAHAVWIYHADTTLAATHNLLYSSEVGEVPLPPEAIHKLLGQAHEVHFFAWTALGLMEIQGATIHPSHDPARLEPSRGYLFAARRWTAADLHEMSLLAGNVLSIEKSEQPGTPPPSATVMRFTRPLLGWDGRLVATLVVRNGSPLVELLNHSSRRLFIGTLLFALGLFLALVSSLTYWLSRPLKALSEGLRLQDLARLERLQSKGDEFGELARMMKEFFQQRQSLMREIADRQLAEEALREARSACGISQKMEAVGRLAGGVAHDFNNLLTAIIGYSRLIEQRTQEPSTRDDVALIGKAGERAADLTRQLLAFSRKQILQPRVIELSTLVGEIQKLLGRVIGEKIDLRFEAFDGPTRVYADPTQLEQVVLNLGVNARDAMPRGGLLTMRTGQRRLVETLTHPTGALPQGKYVTLEVQDNGCGMDAETQVRIFEPFFTTKGPGQGTGLGLATAYGIVDQSGGGILVESAPGEGAKFTVLLPYVEAELYAEEVPLSTVESGAPLGTVLVVEDEDIVKELVCAVLEGHGYHVLSAPHGLAGLAQAKAYAGKIDLLLTDVIMPQMTGPEVARELQIQRPGIKVLFVSGYSEVDISEDGVLTPGVNLLPKPFTPDTLLRRVKEALQAEAS